MHGHQEGVIANATYVFDEFAVILINHKRPNCKLSDAAIKRIFEEHMMCLLLWDGAFSSARKVNPSDQDCHSYVSFVRAAVDCHVRIGCSVTHKVHLMLCHVLHQMITIPRGLGEKMEDWIELRHQMGNRGWIRFCTTQNLEARAIQRARSDQRGTHAEVKSRIIEKKGEFTRNWNEKNSVGSVEDECLV